MASYLTIILFTLALSARLAKSDPGNETEIYTLPPMEEAICDVLHPSECIPSPAYVIPLKDPHTYFVAYKINKNIYFTITPNNPNQISSLENLQTLSSPPVRDQINGILAMLHNDGKIYSEELSDSCIRHEGCVRSITTPLYGHHVIRISQLDRVDLAHGTGNLRFSTEPKVLTFADWQEFLKPETQTALHNTIANMQKTGCVDCQV
jgi:hypothetical protein